MKCEDFVKYMDCPDYKEKFKLFLGDPTNKKEFEEAWLAGDENYLLKVYNIVKQQVCDELSSNPFMDLGRMEQFNRDRMNEFYRCGIHRMRQRDPFNRTEKLSEDLKRNMDYENNRFDELYLQKTLRKDMKKY